MKILKRIIRSLYKRLWTEEWYKVKNLHKVNALENLSFLELWATYLKENNIDELSQILKKDLACDDINVVDIILSRIEYLLLCSSNKDMLYIDIGCLYTPNEKVEQVNSKRIVAEYYKDGCFSKNLYEPNVLYEHCGLRQLPFVYNYIANKDFIDGGACIGDSALIFEKFYKPKCIHAFEPLSVNHIHMNNTIKVNKLNLVKPVKLGLGKTYQNIELSYNPANYINTSLFKDNECENEKINELVKVVSIDSYVHKNNLNLGLIKLDVEGAESDVILGAIESIKKFRPVMLISIYHTPRDFFEIKPLIESLNLGYKFKIRKCSPSTIYLETMLLCYPAELEG